MSEEEKKNLFDDPSLYIEKLDDYNYPSLLVKVIKSMKKNEVCEFITDKIEKLRNNFISSYFD